MLLRPRHAPRRLLLGRVCPEIVLLLSLRLRQRRGPQMLRLLVRSPDPCRSESNGIGKHACEMKDEHATPLLEASSAPTSRSKLLHICAEIVSRLQVWWYACESNFSSCVRISYSTCTMIDHRCETKLECGRVGGAFHQGQV